MHALIYLPDHGPSEHQVRSRAARQSIALTLWAVTGTAPVPSPPGDHHRLRHASEPRVPARTAGTHGAADGPAIALAAFPRLASDLLSTPGRRPGLSGQALREPHGAAARVTDIPITPAVPPTISTTAALAWRPTD